MEKTTDCTVQVLMSTYNGQKYVEEQIASIEQQQNVKVQLLIRDDSSTDLTVDCVERLSRQYGNIHLIQGENMGPCKSFFTLVTMAEETCEYYAFSDQDDVWKTEKLSRAVEKLKVYKEEPAIYCSRVELVDAEKNPLPDEGLVLKKQPDFSNALVENICTGCTLVWNRAFQKIIQHNIPAYTIMHDWWFYLIGSAFAHVIYDDWQSIYYRQHGNNSVGIAASKTKKWKRRLRAFREQNQNLQRQITALLNIELPEEKRSLVKQICQARKHPTLRWKLWRQRAIYRQGRIDNWIYQVLLLLGKI